MNKTTLVTSQINLVQYTTGSKLVIEQWGEGNQPNIHSSLCIASDALTFKAQRVIFMG